MRAIYAVYRRELRLYFQSPIAYGVAFALLLLLGLFMSSVTAQMIDFNQNQLAFGGQGFGADELLNNVLGLLAFLLVFIAPALTMRLLAQEAREGTLETLMTLPMRDSAFVAGKFLAVWTYYTMILLLTSLQIPLLNTIGRLDPGLTFAIYLGAWLYGGAALAISMIFSAITAEQIVAFFLGIGALLLLFLADAVAIWASGQDLTAWAADLIRELGLVAHYQDTMALGLIRAQDLLYFVLAIVGALFITTLIVSSRRWRS